MTHQLQYLQAATQILILKEVGGNKIIFGKVTVFQSLDDKIFFKTTINNVNRFGNKSEWATVWILFH